MKNSWDAYWGGRDKSFLEQVIERYKMEKGYGRLVEAVSDTGVKNGGRVLEVGAGKAGISRLLKARGWSTYAVDINHAMAKKTSGDIPNYVVENMFTLPFTDRSFGLIVSCGLLEHFDPNGVNAILKEMKRVGCSITAWLPSCGPQWKILWAFRNILGGDVFTQVYVYQFQGS